MGLDKTVKGEPTSGRADLFNWVKGSSSSIFSIVAEKAKNSVDAVLTTLDPQMKDALNCKKRRKLIFKLYLLIIYLIFMS